MSVQRYKPFLYDERDDGEYHGFAGMAENESGEWVEWSEHAMLLAVHAELKADYETALERLASAEKERDKANGYAALCRAQLSLRCDRCAGMIRSDFYEQNTR